jgi:hypothetical protein
MKTMNANFSSANWLLRTENMSCPMGLQRNSPAPLGAKFVRAKASLALVVGIAVLFPPTAALAQSSKSDVQLDTAVITNAAVLGSKANQSIDIGNGSGGGQAKVTGKTAVVTNAAVLGSTANQTTKIGNADGSNSKSSVKFDTLVQSNAAVLGSTSNQNLEIGNAANGGDATVNLKTVVVTNAGVLGSKSNQSVKIGNAK